MTTNKNAQELVGIVPAAGSAKRISPLPCSKEIFPVGFYKNENIFGSRPKAAAQHLLEKMQMAGAQKAFIVIRKGKWDIPAYFTNCDFKLPPLAFISISSTSSVPFTIDQAFPFINNAVILFGFPDILSVPDDCFRRLLCAQNVSNADIVLGLYEADKPQKMDMVELDSDKRVRSIHVKPNETALSYTWIIAVWVPRFTFFMHQFLTEWAPAGEKRLPHSSNSSPKELYMGDVIQAAIDNNLSVGKVIFQDGKYIDIGTPDDLEEAVRSWGDPILS